MKIAQRAHYMRLRTKLAGATAWLCLLLALALLLLLDDKRWGAAALGLSVSLAGVFAVLEIRSAPPADGASAKSQAAEPPPVAREPHEALPVHPATGLYRRWVFRERLEGEIARASRHHHELTVMLLEPEDVLDEPTPDAYTRASRSLRRALRTSDFAAQFDDQRFVILLPETDEAQAQAAGRRLLAALQSSGEPPIRWLGAVVCYPDDGEDADHLLDGAARALRQGRVESARKAVSEAAPEDASPESA